MQKVMSCFSLFLAFLEKANTDLRQLANYSEVEQNKLMMFLSLLQVSKLVLHNSRQSRKN